MVASAVINEAILFFTVLAMIVLAQRTPREKLPEYPLAPDFMDMVRIFETDDLSEFFYTGDWGVQLL